MNAGLLRENIVLLLLLSLAVILVMAGESMLTAALPDIEHEFPVPGLFESWVLPVVLLTGAAASPFIGGAGDRYGHKKLLIICLCIYLAGLIGGLFAPCIWALLISRALQGAGIAAFPLGYAIIRERFSETQADTGIGVISAMYGAGTFIGVIVGSYITGLYSWRLTYLLLIPAMVILILCIAGLVENDHPQRKKGSLDINGFISLVAFLFLVLTFFSMPPGSGLLAPAILVLCLVAFYLFIRSECRASSPLADIRLLKRRPVAVFMTIGFLVMLAFFILLQMMPYIIRMPTGLGLATEMVGLVIIPGTICDMIAGPLTGRAIPVIGCRIPCIIGSVLLLLAGIILLIFPLSVMLLVIAWMIFSFGMSVAATADLIGVMDYAGPGRTGEATGVIQSMQTLGGMAGPVLTGIILATSQVSLGHMGEEWTVPAPETYSLVFMSIILISIVLLFVSGFLVRDPDIHQGDII